MKQLFVKLYEWLTAGMYRRLMRDTTMQLQDISRAYIDQHEMLTAKLVDEIVRLNLRVEQVESALYARNYEHLSAFNENNAEEDSPGKMSEEEIYEILKDASSTLDVVTFCAKRDIPIQTYYEIDAKYRGFDPQSLRRMRVLEETNLELRRLLTQLLRANGQALATAAPSAKSENGNGNGRQ
jgi:hypothetical protein